MGVEIIYKLTEGAGRWRMRGRSAEGQNSASLRLIKWKLNFGLEHQNLRILLEGRWSRSDGSDEGSAANPSPPNEEI